MFRPFVLLVLFALIVAPLLAGQTLVAARDRHRAPRELVSGRLPAAEAGARAARSDRPTVKDRYIVVLDRGKADPRRTAFDMAAASAGVIPTHVYRHLFDGFAAEIPAGKVGAIRNDPRVKAVLPDREVYAAAQVVPTGIDRVDVDRNPTADIDGNDRRVDVDVAVLDTAGNESHPDLNVWAYANCTDSPSDLDDHGHGTHVAGTIAALDNGIGVVGVAPGARLWNVRVLRNAGGESRGALSWVICGLDLVARYATDQGDGLGDIEVANVSIYSPGSDSSCQGDAYHQAFCQVVAAGITVVVCAGNEGENAANFKPAAYDEVITVSALADSDGKPGGLGRATWAGPDDSLATFSNFGADIDLAAPGVDIRSTVPIGPCPLCDPSGYNVLYGTSMAAPHVTGAAALYKATQPNASPAEVKQHLLSTRQKIALPRDPDGVNEGVLYVGPRDTKPPTVQIVAPDQIGAGKTLTLKTKVSDDVGVTVVAFGVCQGSKCTWNSARALGNDTSAPFSTKWKAPKKGTFTFLARAKDATGKQTVSRPVTVKVKT